MNSIHDNIGSLFNLYDRDISSLERIIRDNPASALARIILLKKYKETDHPDFEKLKAETASYVTNIPWYLYLLLEEAETEEQESDTPENRIAAAADASPPIEIQEKEEPSALQQDESSLETSVDSLHPGTEETTDVIAEQPAVEEEVAEESQIVDSDDGETEDTSIELEEADEEPDPDHEDTVEPVSETGNEPDPQEHEDRGVETDEETAHPPSQHDEPELKEEKAEENDAVFEPLYAIDYFASQGIKLTEKDLKDDKLSQQVKSFTGWLKSMKQLHPNKLPEQDAVIEKIIQNASEVSNVESEVLTEAMAEVLVKQNKKNKAIEMYQKLSLKNPSKSAYFAAKIDHLKTT